MRVDLVADGLPLVESWVAASIRLGRHVRVLGEVVAPAGVEDDTVEAVEQIAETARRTGNVERQGPPGLREAEGCGVAAPNRFSTARKLAAPLAESRSTTVRIASS